MTEWLTEWLSVWLTPCLSIDYWLTNDWLLSVYVTDLWLNTQFNWLTEWLTLVWLTGWLSDWLVPYGRMDRMSVWLTDWIRKKNYYSPVGAVVSITTRDLLFNPMWCWKAWPWRNIWPTLENRKRNVHSSIKQLVFLCILVTQTHIKLVMYNNIWIQHFDLLMWSSHWRTLLTDISRYLFLEYLFLDFSSGILATTKW